MPKSKTSKMTACASDARLLLTILNGWKHEMEKSREVKHLRKQMEALRAMSALNFGSTHSAANFCAAMAGGPFGLSLSNNHYIDCIAKKPKGQRDNEKDCHWPH